MGTSLPITKKIKVIAYSTDVHKCAGMPFFNLVVVLLVSELNFAL